jgi:site-specific DNA-methyltransferase (adenine-specific)
MNRTIQTESVFSHERIANKPDTKEVLYSGDILINQPNVIDGRKLLASINNNVITTTFFDPQYRGVLDKLAYGNEGRRQKGRSELQQMSEETIKSFIQEIDRVLVPSGHLFLWIDKFHLCEGISPWIKSTTLSIVDLITWNKGKIGMGYRTRRKSEYLLVLQKQPNKAKGYWTRHDIPDVWTEKIIDKKHPHQKPIGLQSALIEAVSAHGDYILDPCAGSYEVLNACRELNRNFIGGDVALMQL